LAAYELDELLIEAPQLEQDTLSAVTLTPETDVKPLKLELGPETQ
jgi:hypothetical protein